MNDNEIQQRFPSAFQFGLRTLLVATVVSAAIASLASSMHVPVIGRAIVALFLIAYATYVILRVPGLLRCHRAVEEHLNKVRADILIEVETARNNLRNSESDDV